MFSSVDAAEKYKNTIIFLFLPIQHATRAAEKLLKLSLKDAQSAIEYTSPNDPGKRSLEEGGNEQTNKSVKQLTQHYSLAETEKG